MSSDYDDLSVFIKRKEKKNKTSTNSYEFANFILDSEIKAQLSHTANLQHVLSGISEFCCVADM